MLASSYITFPRSPGHIRVWTIKLSEFMFFVWHIEYNYTYLC